MCIASYREFSFHPVSPMNRPTNPDLVYPGLREDVYAHVKSWGGTRARWATLFPARAHTRRSAHLHEAREGDLVVIRVPIQQTICARAGGHTETTQTPTGADRHHVLACAPVVSDSCVNDTASRDTSIMGIFSTKRERP
jgi:hypothetical protein